MTRRSPLMVVVLSIITFGIYALVWYVITKREMNRRGARIPTALLIIIPLVNIYWMWKFSEGVEKVTKGGLAAAVAFLLLLFIGIIGIPVTQSALNKVPRKAPAKRPKE